MSYFQLKELEDVADDHVLLAYAEVLSFFLGECGLSDIPRDESELVQSFIKSVEPNERLDLSEEPQFALQRAFEEIETKILELASHNAQLMDNHYPFEVAPRPGVLLALKPGIRDNLEGVCYLCMQLNHLHAFDFLEFGTSPGGREDKPHLDFTQPFEKLFEVISGIVTANENQGMAVLLSESRSHRALLDVLKDVCTAAGCGEPKDEQQLNIIQRRSNDGGIDAVILKKEGAELRETTLVGATIQKSNLRVKMIGPTSVNRFKGFLIDGNSLAPYRGSFVHPMPYDIGHKELCQESNCTYFHKEMILRFLRPLNASTILARRCRAASKRAAIKQLELIQSLTFRIEFSDFLLSNVGQNDN